MTKGFDEDKWTDKYCRSKKCTACDGTDESGEPNGYGCKSMFDYVQTKYKEFEVRQLKKIKAVKQ